MAIQSSVSHARSRMMRLALRSSLEDSSTTMPLVANSSSTLSPRALAIRSRLGSVATNRPEKIIDNSALLMPIAFDISATESYPASVMASLTALVMPTVYTNTLYVANVRRTA